MKFSFNSGETFGAAEHARRSRDTESNGEIADLRTRKAMWFALDIRRKGKLKKTIRAQCRAYVSATWKKKRKYYERGKSFSGLTRNCIRYIRVASVNLVSSLKTRTSWATLTRHERWLGKYVEAVSRLDPSSRIIRSSATSACVFETQYASSHRVASMWRSGFEFQRWNSTISRYTRSGISLWPRKTPLLALTAVRWARSENLLKILESGK